MGYSISQRTAELLDKRSKEGRLCNMDRPHIARAVWKVVSRVWSYTEDRRAGKPYQMNEAVFCNRCFERYIKPWIGVTDLALDTNQEIVSAAQF